jgi:hypothetical protein
MDDVMMPNRHMFTKKIVDSIELDFGALSIDNDILKSEGYKLDEGLLALFHQFNGSPIAVVKSDIVHNEATSHIGNEIYKARNATNQSFRSAAKQVKVSHQAIEQAEALLSVEGDDRSIATQRLGRFYEEIGAEIIQSSRFADSGRRSARSDRAASRADTRSQGGMPGDARICCLIRHGA